eukprot:gene7261-11579_t
MQSSSKQIEINLNRLLNHKNKAMYNKDIQSLIEKLPIEKKIIYQNKLKNEKKEKLFEKNEYTQEEEAEEEGMNEDSIEDDFTTELSSIAEELKSKSKMMNDTIKEDDYLINHVEDLTNENMKHLLDDHSELKKYESKLNQNFNQYYLLFIVFVVFILMYAIIKIFPK